MPNNRTRGQQTNKPAQQNPYAGRRWAYRPSAIEIQQQKSEYQRRVEKAKEDTDLKRKVRLVSAIVTSVLKAQERGLFGDGNNDENIIDDEEDY